MRGNAVNGSKGKCRTHQQRRETVAAGVVLMLVVLAPGVADWFLTLVAR